MNKAWLTGFTVAGIAGSAGAAFAGVNAIHNASAESSTAATSATTGSTDPQAVTRTVTYQVGTAARVTLSSDGTTLTVTNSVVGVGWTLVNSSAPGAHVEVSVTDGQQLVTFLADQVGDQIVVSVTNVEAPGATTSSVPAPIKITIVSETPNDGRDEQSGPTPTPAPTPAPTPPTTEHLEHATTSTPTPATTSAPSHKTGGDDGEHEGDGGHDD